MSESCIDIGSVADLGQFMALVSPPDSGISGVRMDSTGYTSPGEVFTRIMRRRANELPTRVVFRGQARKSWQLVPQIDRHDFADFRRARVISRGAHEQNLLQPFIRAARPHLLSGVPDNDWEWLALAQHHRLATRLLDWSTSPLVALYFAVAGSDNGGEESVVWAYSHSGSMASLAQSPFSIDCVVLFHPAYVSPRINAQGGCFTVHPESTAAWAGSLYMISIKADARARLQRQLLGLNLNPATLFPDLDGISSAVNGRLSLATHWVPVRASAASIHPE